LPPVLNPILPVLHPPHPKNWKESKFKLLIQPVPPPPTSW
jgi:hypothetical protein